MLENVASERAVLAGLFRYGQNLYLDVANILDPLSFTGETNQLVYTCMDHVFKNSDQKQLDLGILLSTAKDLGINLNKKDDLAHVNGLMKFPVVADTVRSSAVKIKKLQVMRELYDRFGSLQKTLMSYNGNETISEVISTAENSIYDFTASLYEEDEGPSKLFEGAKERLDHLAANPTDNIGIPTPYPLYNKAIGGGLRRAAVSLIGARSKVGKSFFGLNTALHVAENLNIPVLILDTEMRKEDTQDRAVANVADHKNATINNIETGQFGKSPAEKQSVYDAVEKRTDLPIYHMNISGMSFEQQISIMRRWVMKTVGINKETGKTNDCLIIYDYLKLMDSEDMQSQNLQEYQMLGFMMTGLHNFTVKYDLPILSFIQLNRDGITKESADAASGSDRIIWLCSNFTIYKFKSDEEKAEDGINAGDRKLVPVLARHGEGLKDGEYINMVFDGPKGRIEERGTNYQKIKDANCEVVGFDGPEEDIPF